MAGMSTRNGQHEVQQHAPVQRQILNRLTLDDLAQARVLSLQSFRNRGNDNAFTLPGHAEDHIEGHVLSNFEPHLACAGLESRCDCLHNVRARQ